MAKAKAIFSIRSCERCPCRADDLGPLLYMYQCFDYIPERV